MSIAEPHGAPAAVRDVVQDDVFLPQRFRGWLPGIVAVASPEQLAEHGRLRQDWVGRGDVAWVRVRQPTQYDPLARLSRDLLDAMGNVGLATPRAVGERHLYRALPYLMHSSIRHVVVDDAQWLPEPVLHHLQDVLGAAGAQAWLLYERPYPASVPEVVADLFGGLVSADYARTLLAGQRTPPQPAHGDALELADRWDELPVRPKTCNHTNRAHCLGRAVGRGVSSGTLSAEEGRALLIGVLERPSTTVEDQWAMREFGRETFNPARDALRLILPSSVDPRAVRVRDLAPDATSVAALGRSFAVPAPLQPALRRQRTHTIFCNGPDDYPLLSVFERAYEPLQAPSEHLRASEERAVAVAAQRVRATNAHF